MRKAVCNTANAFLKIREGGNGGGRIIEGYAILFNVKSRLINDGAVTCYEVIKPEAITRDMLAHQDIKLTLFHDRQQILARSKNGTGTLHYTIDTKGVKFWAEMPNTAEGDKALELVKRGDIDGCSFMYSTDEDDKKAVAYSTVGGTTIRTVKRINNVYDFTLTPDPAYIQTTVNARSFQASNRKSSLVASLRNNAADARQMAQLAGAVGELHSKRQARKNAILSKYIKLGPSKHNEQ